MDFMNLSRDQEKERSEVAFKYQAVCNASAVSPKILQNQSSLYFATKL